MRDLNLIYVASFNRASDGAISKLVNKIKEENMWTDDYKKADYILAVGDRKETFDFVLERYRENKKIIHLWAGEISQGTHDEVYRHSITLMSCIQLCTNEKAKERVKALCKAVDKTYRVAVIGNIMLDNMDTYLSVPLDNIPDTEYDVVLYNPPTSLEEHEIMLEINRIINILGDNNYIWIEPNGDKYSELVQPYVTHKTFDRDEFLMLLYHCNRFITNSSSAYYEGQFLVSKDNIIPIGKRNRNRESKYGDMTIPNASENVMKILRSLT